MCYTFKSDSMKAYCSLTNTGMMFQQLEQDITGHQEKVQDVLDAAQVFKEAKHFMNKELQASARTVSERSVFIGRLYSVPIALC